MAALGTDGVLGNLRGPRAGWRGGRGASRRAAEPGTSFPQTGETRRSSRKGRRQAPRGEDARTAPQGREARGGGAKPARTAGTGPSALVTRAKARPAARWAVDGGRGALLARGAAHAATPASLGDVPSLAGQFCG